MYACAGAREGRPVEVAASASGFRFDASARFPRFIGAAEDAAARVAALRVAVVGAGAIGGRIADHVARLGVTSLAIVDRGSFRESSVVTQAIPPDAVGAPKASWTAERARAVSPATLVTAFDGALEALSADAFHDVDVVLLASDNLAAEVEAGRRCVRLGRRLIQGSVHGESLTAEVRVFGAGEGGPCPACAFTAEEWAQLARGTRFACDPGIDWRDAAPVPGDDAVPTTSVSALCSLAADLAVTQLIRGELSLGRSTSDRVITYCGYTDEIRTAPLRRRPGCPADHRRVVRHEVASLASRSLAELARHAEAIAPGVVSTRGPAFAADDRRFVTRARCACGAASEPMRFLASGWARACDACGGSLEVQPYFAHATAAHEVVAAVVDEPLARLVDGVVTGVTVWGDEGGVWFREEVR